MTLLEKLNKEDHFASGIGARLTEVREGYSRTEIDIEERHLNGGGVCQGGVIYTLADLAFAAVANCRGVLTLGICNNITFLQSAMLGDHLMAECTEVLDHHKLPYCDMRITNQDGKLIAVMTGLAYRLKKDFDFEGLS